MRLFLFAIVAAAVAGCPHRVTSRFSEADASKVSVGMTEQEVHSLIGPPTEMEERPYPSVVEPDPSRCPGSERILVYTPEDARRESLLVHVGKDGRVVCITRLHLIHTQHH